MKPKIGVLALQGDFREHLAVLDSMSVRGFEVRGKPDLGECSALIIPGGESTSMARLMDSSGLRNEILHRAKKGMPVYGTCAGAILLSKKIVAEKRFRPLGLIGIEVKRNAFGRQIDSFEAEIDVNGAGQMSAVFIRAPRIVKCGNGVEALAKLGKEPVLARQGNVIAGTFHPEVSGNAKIHELLLGMLSSQKNT